MTLTNQANYALRAMMFLTREHNGKWISSTIIAEEMGIPRMFLSRINMQLVEAGLMKSRRGAGGGVRLAREPEAISLYEVVDAIDGPLLLDKCLANPDEHCYPMAEQHHAFWQDIQHSLDLKLKKTSLQDLITLPHD